MSSVMPIQSILAKLLCEKPQTLPAGIMLTLPNKRYAIYSNSQSLLDQLHHYFGHLSTWQTDSQPDSPSDETDLQTVYLYQTDLAQALIHQIPWEDWTREASKSGRKDAVFDGIFDNQSIRLLHKVKTGMLFIQPAGMNSKIPLMAFGDTQAHPNQMINFVLTQYLNQHLRKNWLLGHAAGVQIQGKGLAIAGLSGGGKSTLMLHLLEDSEHFISNDRVLFSPNKTSNGRLILRGIPKQPRINPGTIVHNPRLHSLMTSNERNHYLTMPSEQLRAIEKKYDAMVDELYSANCYAPETQLDALVILNWSATSTQNTSLNPTTLEASTHLTAAIMKSPGPFYSDATGNFLQNGLEPKIADYLPILGNVPVLELNGQVDFIRAKQLVLEHLNR